IPRKNQTQTGPPASTGSSSSPSASHLSKPHPTLNASSSTQVLKNLHFHLDTLSPLHLVTLSRIIRAHVTTNPRGSAPIQPPLPPRAGFADEVRGRAVLVKKTTVIPIECVARGYLAGSGWKEYQKTQPVCGIKLPPGLKQSDKLPDPIFTPATKEESGHDINVSFEETVERIGKETATTLRDRRRSL